MPTGSETSALFEVANELGQRLTSIFIPDADGRRPLYSGTERFQTDPNWKDMLQFASTSTATTTPAWRQPSDGLDRPCGQVIQAGTTSDRRTCSPLGSAETSYSEQHHNESVAVGAGHLRAEHRGVAARRR
jgi:hypothetical protein